MTILQTEDLAVYAPQIVATGSALTNMIMRVENFIAGKLRKQTLDDYTYKELFEIAEITDGFNLNHRPIVSVTEIKIKYGGIRHFGLDVQPEWQVLVADEDYELDYYHGRIELLNHMILNRGKTKVSCEYVSGFSNLTDNILPADMQALKLAIGKGLEVIESGLSRGIKRESFQGETTLEYVDYGTKNGLESVLEPYLQTLIYKYQAC